MTSFFSSPRAVFAAAIALRAMLLVYGLFQDAHSPMKYTDIDYYVFTDAARFMSRGQSPYARDTYRYTPLLAWILLPTTWGGWWFSFGKILFAAGDIIAGWLILLILRSSVKLPIPQALKYASIWLLNPMVATISTRGSSEGLLGVFVITLLWAVLQRNVTLAGLLLGFGVHFKIYPFIYATSIVWWMDEENLDSDPTSKPQEPEDLAGRIVLFFNSARLKLALSSFISFMLLNLLMFSKYENDFIQHSYLHHFTRIDHRHNFSPYNTLLYLNSSPAARSTLQLESLAFIPQLLLSAVIIPIALAKYNLPSTMLAQTFAFVTFNKVCTSQYFLWYIVFLPFYLPSSSLLQRPSLGVVACVLWILGQAVWLQQGYQLEFLGKPTFIPGLWLSGIFFFLVNVWILGIVISDIGCGSKIVPKVAAQKKKR
ncbi:glycosyltransferase family 50 protein [Aulographum hederae CBS 113979]|uniref:GPI mannosyltransferase 1 n=1 Tax=Aulographum hederae CBS 113979 TaxID=1176131 RepID=A0A6G1HBP1_9PEZI|nr:glycosyltransferase family 50 protein [Aulographum hederae CBS 113979]